MLRNLIPILFAGIMIIGCATQSTHRSYKDMFNDDDFAAERYSPQFLEEVQRECPSMLEDLATLKEKISDAERSGRESMLNKTRSEYKQLKGWIRMVDCQYDASKYEAAPAKKTSPAAVEVKPYADEIQTDKNLSEPVEMKTAPTQSSFQKSQPGIVAPLTFDECFQKCREFTSRSKEECFDTCLGK